MPPFSQNQNPRRAYLHYEILTRPDGSLWELGRSAQGVTYKAQDVNLGTLVALKVVAENLAARPEAREELRQAVQAAARVHHPNVAGVFHFGIVEAPAARTEESRPAGECFYTMEFVEGETLEERVRRRGPLEPLLALEIALQVARALAEAEKRGLARRGIRPSNVMLASEQPIAPSAAERRPAVWVKVINLGLERASPQEPEGGSADADLDSLGRILRFALSGEKDAVDPGATLPDRRIPPALAVLLERSGEKPRPSLATITGEMELLLKSLGETAAARRRRWTILGGLLLGAVLLGLALSSRTWFAPRDKSISVLPFRHPGQDPGAAFFAEGLRDDIVSRLVKVRDLKVINHPRTGGATGQVPDSIALGRRIGVRYLLSGDVRRAGDRVLLDVSLVDAIKGKQIWAEKYDRQLKDAINLQGELASNVTAALDAELTAAERSEVRASLTLNPDAYVLYLRGRKLENSVTTQVSNFEAAAALYSQAIALDPGFALAHAQLAGTLGLLYRFRGPSEELRIRAAREVAEALRLQPDLGEAHLVKGANLYRIERDFERALAALQIARDLLPNDAAPRFYIALIHRRQGRWREARSGLEEANQLDPQHRKYLEELHATASLLRDWPAAARYADLALAMAPEVTQLKAERALVDFWQKGDFTGLQKLIRPEVLTDVKEDTTWAGWDVALLARDFMAAEAVVDRYPLETLPTVLGAPIPKDYLRGCIWLAQGDRARAEAALELARPSLEAEIMAKPGNAMRHARLGLLYAYLGRKSEALREGKRAVELTPVSEDAVDGHHWACHLALIHAWVGNTAEAVAMIESLLRQPGCVSPLNEASLTLSDLRLRWQWDPLRRDPHFQRILAGPEPPTAY